MTTDRDRIIALVAETFSVPAGRISSESRWDELDHDSLDLVELIIAVQEELAVDLDPKELTGLATVGDLLALVERRRRG